VPQLILTLALVGIGWFLLIRPQQARLREQRALVAALEVGDRVVTAGGIHGTIVSVADETVLVEIAPDVRITLARPAITRRATIEDHGQAPAEEAGDVTETHDEAGRPPALGGAA
jgi:preprotein translocase subunit YajC